MKFSTTTTFFYLLMIFLIIKTFTLQMEINKINEELEYNVQKLDDPRGYSQPGNRAM